MELGEGLLNHDENSDSPVVLSVWSLLPGSESNSHSRVFRCQDPLLTTRSIGQLITSLITSRTDGEEGEGWVEGGGGSEDQEEGRGRVGHQGGVISEVVTI